MHTSRRAVADMQRELDDRRAQIGDVEMNAAASLEAMLALLRALTMFELTGVM
jgi:hypothetical protein